MRKKTVAFLRVLNPDNISFELEKIHTYFHDRNYVVKPYEEYTPNGWDHRLIVWRFKKMHRLTDVEVIKIVGIHGNIMYIWECPRCMRMVTRTEYPQNHNHDIEFGCKCLEKT